MLSSCSETVIALPFISCKHQPYVYPRATGNTAHQWFFFFLSEKTKNLLFNGTKTVKAKTWTGEERCTGHEPPACQALLRGQTLIGHDGRLMKANMAQGQPELGTKSSSFHLCNTISLQTLSHVGM